MPLVAEFFAEIFAVVGTSMTQQGTCIHQLPLIGVWLGVCLVHNNQLRHRAQDVWRAA